MKIAVDYDPFISKWTITEYEQDDAHSITTYTLNNDGSIIKRTESTCGGAVKKIEGGLKLD